MSETARRRAAVTRRDGPNCYWCGIAPESGTEHTLDHVIPKSAGGSNKISNLVLACEPCNQDRGGVHGPGSHKPGTVSRPKNLHGRFEPPATLPGMPIVPDDVSPEASAMFAEAVDKRVMEKALIRLQQKYPPKHPERTDR